MKKTSEAKTKANRKNALRSTGPKTKRGKAVVKWNAVKHGLLSRETVIGLGDGKENRAEFDLLFNQLQQDLKPNGTLEHMLVERIAVCYWRLRRAIKCEVGEIRKNLDCALLSDLWRLIDEFRSDQSFAINGLRADHLRRHTYGVQFLVRILEDIKVAVEIEGIIPDREMATLINLYGSRDGEFAHTLSMFSFLATEAATAEENDPDEERADPDKCKAAIITALDGEISNLQDMEKTLEVKEHLDLDARKLSQSLPPKEVTDKILRYETAIERQLYRAMSQLERLQRARLGESVPPPISVEVSSEN